MKRVKSRCLRNFSLMLITAGLCTAFCLEGKTKNTEAAITPTAKQALAIATMKDMSNVKWKPTNDVTIYSKKYAKNTVFTGIPYNQNRDDKKLDFAVACGYKWDSSFGGYIYSSTSGNVGNDCSSAVAIALQSVNSSIKYKNINTTTFMYCTKNGSYSGEGLSLKTVGGYKTNSEYTNTIDYNTLTVYYNKIKPGDVLLYRYKDADGNLHKHVVLVVEATAGSVKITDQIGRSSGDTNSSWRHEKQFSYYKLYEGKFLPIRESSVTA